MNISSRLRWLIYADSLGFVWSQVVQSGGKNIELAIIRRNQPLRVSHCKLYLFVFFNLFLFHS